MTNYIMITKLYGKEEFEVTDEQFKQIYAKERECKTDQDFNNFITYVRELLKFQKVK